MIQIKVDASRFDRTINAIMRDIKELPSARNKNNLSRAAAAIAANKFIKDVNAVARTSPNKYHHLYEWDNEGVQIGVDSARLFRIKRTTNGQVSQLDTKFISSRRKVPIAEILKEAGKNGKVVRRSGIFKNKAAVMESGDPVGFTAQRNIAFPNSSKNKIIFKRKGYEIVIKNPGGKGTTGSLEKFARKWERTQLSAAVRSSGLIQDLDKKITKITSRRSWSSSDIYAGVKEVCDKYDQSTKEF